MPPAENYENCDSPDAAAPAENYEAMAPAVNYENTGSKENYETIAPAASFETMASEENYENLADLHLAVKRVPSEARELYENN
nr:hypothetical protein BaRGS_009148 [Batillaria attramentaria]